MAGVDLPLIPTEHQYFVTETIAEIAALYPAAPRARIAAGFVYSVSAMLALVTSRWRIDALAQDGAAGTLDDLVAFCAAGLGASLT